MRNKKTKKGFTIVELLIATSIFAIFLTSLIGFMVTLYSSSRRIQLQEKLFQDMRAMMRQITTMVESNNIDYEEYFRVATGDKTFGSGNGTKYSYGDYEKQFYDFGWDGPGALCNDKTTPAYSGCIIDKTTLDKNTGKKDGNAFCGSGTSTNPCPVDATSMREQDQLYLINKNGTRKTFIALEPIVKKVNGTEVLEHAISTFWMNGQDTDGDDIVDNWTNGVEFNVIKPVGYDLTHKSTEKNMYDGFIPISPLRSDIVSLKFYISPLEDPYKAFAETDPSSGTLIQPSVTVILTMKPSATQLQNYLGEIPTETLQTTIGT